MKGAPAARACGDEIDCAAADVLNGSEAEANAGGGGSEVAVGDVDVGRENGDAHVAALVDVLDHLGGVAGFGGEERGHELAGEMGFEIAGDEGEVGVGEGVGFVEAVAGELLHEVEGFGGLLFVVAALGGAGEEAGALLGHLLGVLFAHGAAEDVGFAERIAGQAVGDLHHLFLVDHDAVGLFENFLEDGEIVDHLLAAMLAIDEVVDDAALDGAGAVEGVEGAEILDADGLVFAEDVAHAGGFELEDAAGEAFGEDGVGGRIFEGKVVDVELHAAMFFDERDGVVYDVEGGEAEEVHLEKRKLLKGGHVVLSDNFVAICFIKRDEFLEGDGADDDAGGVDSGVAGEALDFAGDFEDLADARVFAGGFLEAGLLFEGVGELNVELVGDELGDALDFGEGQVEGAADVLDGGAGGEGAEGDDLGDLLAAVFFGDVLNDLAAAAGVEIDVDVGHADALGIEEAFEEQAVLKGIDVGDLHGIADEAAGGRAAAGADGDAARFGEADEVPNDEEIAGELHLLDHADFAVEAFGVGGEIVLERAVAMEGFEALAAAFEALADDEFEIGVGGVFGGDVEFGERLLDLFELDLAALGDVPGAVQRVFGIGEEGEHFGARFEVELRPVEAHAILVAHGLAGLDAEEDFVGAGVVAAEVVGVVGGDEREAGVFGEAVDEREEGLVLVEAVVLEFEEEIVFAEEVRVFVGEAAGFVVAVGEEGFVDVAAKAGRERDQAFGVAAEQVLIDAGLVVEAFEIGGGDELDEVAVALLVLAEEDEVVVAVRIVAELAALLGDVDFAADDGVDAGGFGGVVKFDGAEEVAVVGEGDGGGFLLGDKLHELRDFASAI